MNQTYYTPSVDTAARILKMLSRYRTRSSTLSEISGALAASKATSLRVLKTLETHGLVRFEESTKRYSLGYYCVVLGARAEEGLDYLAYLRPIMFDAARSTGLMAAFAQRVSPDRLMYVARESGDQSTDINVSIGNRLPITEVSYGKWFVAYADADERERLLAPGLRQITPRTITNVDAYVAHAERAARVGVLVSESEYNPGVTAVSCPVLGTRSELIGVLALIGLTDRLDGDRLKSVCATMQQVARRCHFNGISGLPAATGT